MEKRIEFQNELEQMHYERLKSSMYNGLIFAENGMIANEIRDAVAYTTSLLLVQGIIPKFTSGGEIWELAASDFLQMYQERIRTLIKKKRQKIKTGHRFSGQTN